MSIGKIPKLIFIAGILLVLLFMLLCLKHFEESNETLTTSQISDRSASVLNKNISFSKKNIVVSGHKISVYLADTEEKQERGLAVFDQLGENEGMLFVFDETGKYSFWMKDMKFAIDIIWIGENKEIIYIKKNATPESYPESFEPENPTRDTKYVLEIPAGFSEKNNLKIGDMVEFRK